MNRRVTRRSWIVAACTLALVAGGPAQAAIPSELFAALGLPETAAPSELYEALVKRYRDPAQGAGKGAFAELWEPIAISRYFDPASFYRPSEVDLTASRQDCVGCHTQVNPGWVHSWQKSAHANLDALRALPDTDPRAYKKQIIAEVERNLRSAGLLAADRPLGEVSCIDCHVGVGRAEADHRRDIKLPDSAACGQCHLQQFAERESERDTLVWPQGQWPAGRPSHALSYRANVETAIWAAMQEREIAEGCTQCHTTQNTCNQCHTRHEFSAAEARRPEVCANCHNGVDHNEYENYLLSRHGIIYQIAAHSWDWNIRLQDSYAAGQKFPTCQTCHMEYEGTYSHNMVRKVRWGFAPMKSIGDNLDHPWFETRKASWIASCTQCHSASFASAWFAMIDNGTKAGIRLVEEARGVMTALHADKLLVGQTDNRPPPPAPDKDEAGGFFGLFWSKGNNPTRIDVEFAEMWEQHVMRHFKGLAHVNPGGFTYTDGWSKLIRSLARIRDEDTRLRERAALQARIEVLEGQARRQQGLLDSPFRRAGFGLGMAGVGLAMLAVPAYRKRKRTPQ